MAPNCDRPEGQLSTSPSPLPSDIIRCIAEHLDDPRTLASLCLLYKQSFMLVIPLLYSTVHLTTVGSISVFCNSILHSSRNLGHYPKSIRFDPPNPADQSLSPLVELIHQALQHTPNLTDLSLRIDTPDILSFYLQYEEPAPYSLERFACYSPRKQRLLLNFFSTQPSIKHLTIYESAQPPSNYATSYIRSPSPIILPNLTSICANALTIYAFVPGRPITHADSGQTVLVNATSYLFCRGLRESTAPGGLESVAACIPQTQFWTGAPDFITRLAGVCGDCLRELRLTMPDLSVGMARLGDYAKLVEVLVASLGEFTRLEHFQFNDKGIEIITPDILVEELGHVGTLALWKKQVTTLQRVTLFGVDLT